VATDFAGYGDGWRYARFVATIQERAGLSLEEAERAAHMTLETLSERLTWGEESELASDLPEQLRSWLLEAEGAVEPFHADEFVRRVAEREGLDAPTAECHVRAVFVALARLVRGPEFDHLVSRLPNDYRPLLH
jgi:uncharacterized protein (DUF2267 family)